MIACKLLRRLLNELAFIFIKIGSVNRFSHITFAIYASDERFIHPFQQAFIGG